MNKNLTFFGYNTLQFSVIKPWIRIRNWTRIRFEMNADPLVSLVFQFSQFSCIFFSLNFEPVGGGGGGRGYMF